MVAVTQRIGSYLGGVSKQSDDKKLPGQVRECFNGFPDPTYGLTKRPGFEHILNIGTGTAYDDGKWFFIKRDNDEEYIGVIKGTAINIWNALTGVAATVTYANGTGYLGATNTNYDIITIQDTSIVINKSKVVTEIAAPTGYNALRSASVVVNTVTANQAYTVDITIGGSKQTATFTTSATPTASDILNDLETDINAMTGSHSSITVTKLDNSLELSHSSADMKVRAVGGIDAESMSSISEQVNNISDLPTQSLHGRKMKVINTSAKEDDFWVNFVAEDGVSGQGFWQETVDPTVSTGLTNSTMPHELVNTATNTFVFREISFVNRIVGDNDSNPQPSFVGNTISAGFFHNNRLGFLSKDNVILSRSGDPFNFYSTTAQTTIDSDPIDISCSAVKPTSLNSVVPTTQGVILFSVNQQFILFSDTGVLTPSTTAIRTLANYRIEKDISPVEVGTTISFVSKTPGYSRVFSMQTRGEQNNPLILDTSRVVKEWISPDIDNLMTSPQNSMIALYGQSLNEVYIYRYYNDGQKNLMESWVSWIMPGTVQFLVTNSDTMYAVTKQANQFTILKTALSQSPEEAIIVSNEGERVNPCFDLYASPSSVVWDAANRRTKCYLPYNDVTTLTPVLMIKGDTSGGTFVESGFTITPERGTDGTGTFFIVPKKNLTNTADGDYAPLNVASDVILGFKYNFDVILPKTYYRRQENTVDFTANLTISRMKFAVGLSGTMGFKLNLSGRRAYSVEFTGDGSTTSFQFNKRDLDYVDESDVKITVNGVRQTGFSFTNDTTITFSTAPANNSEIVFFIEDWNNVQPAETANEYLANDVPLNNETVFTIPIHQRTENFSLRLFDNSPFPVAVNAMMWEGKYTPRFYRRA